MELRNCGHFLVRPLTELQNCGEFKPLSLGGYADASKSSFWCLAPNPIVSLYNLFSDVVVPGSRRPRALLELPALSGLPGPPGVAQGSPQGSPQKWKLPGVCYMEPRNPRGPLGYKVKGILVCHRSTSERQKIVSNSFGWFQTSLYPLKLILIDFSHFLKN